MHDSGVEPNAFHCREHTPCKLSFVYTPYIRYGVSKFGKHESLFSYHKDKNMYRPSYVSYLIIYVRLKTFVDT